MSDGLHGQAGRGQGAWRFWSLSRQELGASGRHAPHHKQKLLSGERTCDVLVASDGLLMLLHRQLSQASQVIS